MGSDIMKHTVYVLKSLKDDNFYIGCTSNLKNRLQYHNSGMVKSTKFRRPLKLIYSEEYSNKYEAYKIESYYKTAKGKKELKNKIINSGSSLGRSPATGEANW